MKYILKFIIIIIFFGQALSAYSMQTIFNVPSADVTPKGKIFLLEEAQFRSWNPGSYHVFTTLSGYGIGHNTEIDVNLFNVGSPATQNISMGTGFKTSIPLPVFKEMCPKREIKLTVGSSLLIGLEGNGVGNWTYVHLSGRLPKVNTRLTAGVSYGTHQVFGVDKTSFIAGVEQPINKKTTLLLDWFSGNEHWAGYLIAGGSYSLPKGPTIFIGYQIPNSSKIGASGFVIQLAKQF